MRPSRYGRRRMDARVLPLLAGVRVLALAGVAEARPAGTGKDGRPNILVVMTDDQAAADVAQMPNVKRLLAKRGTTFADAIDSFPLCCPARATFITGQYAHNHGVDGNFYPYGWYGMKGPWQHAAAVAPEGGLPHRARRQVAERLRRQGRPRRGAQGLRHLARVARRLRLRLLQLHDEPRRSPQGVGRLGLRAQAGPVRERRGLPQPRRSRRRSE